MNDFEWLIVSPYIKWSNCGISQNVENCCQLRRITIVTRPTDTHRRYLHSVHRPTTTGYSQNIPPCVLGLQINENFRWYSWHNNRMQVHRRLRLNPLLQIPASSNFVDELRRIFMTSKSSSDASHAAVEFFPRRLRRILSPVFRRDQSIKRIVLC